MCLHIPTCLCHYLEGAIKQDHTNRFKMFFDNQHIDEIYYFLLDAYELVEDSNSNKFVIQLNKLVQKYLLENSPLSINVLHERVKKNFMELYDAEIDGLTSAKFSLQEKLIPLIQDVQTLAYKNLAGNDFFMEYLKKIEEKTNTKVIEDKKHHRRNACTIS